MYTTPNVHHPQCGHSNRCGQVSSHLAHEANAEDTFSLSGKLSNPNTHTQPGFLATLVRTNKNRAVYDPTHKEVLAAYKREYGKLPSLGDDVTDDEEEDEGGDEDSQESDVDMD